MTGNAFLQSQRSRFAKELQENPETRNKLAALMTLEHESDPTAVAESLMNRMAYTGGTLEKGMTSGFYGPVKMLPGREAELARNPARMAKMNAAIDAALAGSNLIKGATDQGSGNDPNVSWPGGRIVRGGEVYNDWAGGPGGHEGARRFREAQQARVAGSGTTASSEAGEFFTSRGGHAIGTNAPGVDPEFSRRLQRAAEDYEQYLRGGGLAAPPGRSRHGLPTGSQAADIPRGEFRNWIRAQAPRYGLETIRGDEPHIQLNRSVLDRTALNGSMTHKVEGTGSIDVNVNAPPGTNVKARGGGLFKKVAMARQTQMAPTVSGPQSPAGVAWGPE